MKLNHILMAMLLPAALSIPEYSNAQHSDQQATPPSVTDNERIPLSQRWSIQTNALDWALTIANVGFQIDLSSSPYGRFALLGNVRYNPGSHQKNFNEDDTYRPSHEFSLLDTRLELRRYWRRSTTVTRKRKHTPRYWRAYYWGVYASYTDYTLFLKGGYQGKGYTLGGSFGYQIPLYTFRRGVLDLDLGINAGCMYGQYQKRDRHTGNLGAEQKKFLPYPMISELRVGFVYRLRSVKDKYNKSRH